MMKHLVLTLLFGIITAAPAANIVIMVVEDPNNYEAPRTMRDFAEMQLKLEMAQLMLYKAAQEGEHGLPSAQTTALAKLAMLAFLGGLGYSQESLVEYCVRRTRGWMIAGGSIEMLKNRIAEGVFERSFSQRPLKAQ